MQKEKKNLFKKRHQQMKKRKERVMLIKKLKTQMKVWRKRSKFLNVL